jgi:hypothetical protein
MQCGVYYIIGVYYIMGVYQAKYGMHMKFMSMAWKRRVLRRLLILQLNTRRVLSIARLIVCASISCTETWI